jgi:hypothetical protein
MRIKKCSHKHNSKRCRRRYRGGEGEPQEEKKNETDFFKDLKMPDMSSISNIFNDAPTSNANTPTTVVSNPTSNPASNPTSNPASNPTSNTQSWWGGYRKKYKTNKRRNKRKIRKTRKHRKTYKRK